MSPHTPPPHSYTLTHTLTLSHTHIHIHRHHTVQGSQFHEVHAAGYPQFANQLNPAGTAVTMGCLAVCLMPCCSWHLLWGGWSPPGVFKPRRDPRREPAMDGGVAVALGGVLFSAKLQLLLGLLNTLVNLLQLMAIGNHSHMPLLPRSLLIIIVYHAGAVHPGVHQRPCCHQLPCAAATYRPPCADGLGPRYSTLTTLLNQSTIPWTMLISAGLLRLRYSRELVAHKRRDNGACFSCSLLHAVQTAAICVICFRMAPSGLTMPTCQASTCPLSLSR